MTKSEQIKQIATTLGVSASQVKSYLWEYIVAEGWLNLILGGDYDTIAMVKQSQPFTMCRRRSIEPRPIEPRLSVPSEKVGPSGPIAPAVSSQPEQLGIMVEDRQDGVLKDLVEFVPAAFWFIRLVDGPDNAIALMNVAIRDYRELKGRKVRVKPDPTIHKTVTTVIDHINSPVVAGVS